MKKITIIFIFFLMLVSFSQAQDWRNFNEGKIVGTITDKDKKEGIPGVSVVIKHLRDSTYTKGFTTNEKGEFIFENLKAGRYELYTDAVGMKKFMMTNIPVMPKMPEAKIPPIVLEDDTKTLNEVVIEDKKDFMQVTADAIIINPQNNPNTQSGTAADVLRDVPSVRVDESGNVTMRGGRPNILINGRQSNFGGGGGRGGMGGGMGGGGLDQISADDVESIEINSNPSAKYDADGVSGMINVKLKRDKQPGTHGNVNLAVGNRQRVFGGFRVSHKTAKWTTSLGYNARFDNRLAENLTDRTTFFPNNNVQFLSQNRNFKIHSENNNIRAGVEFSPNEKTTFTFDATIGVRKSWNDGDLLTKTFNNGIYNNGSSQGTNTSSNSLSYDFTLGYRTELKKKGQEITATIATSLGNGDDRQSLVNRIMMGDGTTINTNILTQSTLNGTKNNITTLQFDYTHPLAEKYGTIETGYKAIIRNLNTNFDLDSINKNNNNAWERNLLRSNDFTYNESVHATYISYKNKTGKWDYTAGLRFEQVWLDGNTINQNQNTSFQKQYFNIFPTARIAYNFGQGQFIKLSYSKRIDRPNFDDLNPFVDVSNPRNLRQGNPDLNPEKIHVLELGYNKFWKNFSLSPNIFYRKRWNLSQRVLTLQQDNITTISTPINIGSSDAFGVDITGSFDPVKLKWFTLSGGISAFQTTINAGAGQVSNINSTVQTWNGRLNANFTLWKGARLQIGYMYNAPTATAQGENIGFYSFNGGLMQTLDKKKKWSLNLMVRDIFYSMRFGSTTRTETLIQNSIILRDTRMIMLRLNYKF
ncbi:MAG: TonB-dependent receptor [Bacteroidetes bacterium]|nr:MAG: TonB-dependent receptor [Bacteroidota bacterium]TAG95843.1 MAG: TonB-dependent receptor [Bacteroidota bacterium]